jgi:hypothetical protein
MPLTRETEDFLVRDGVRFRMTDGTKSVPCRVTHETLQEHAVRVRMTGGDGEIFKANRDLIEEVASDLFDAGTHLENDGGVLVTSSALRAA